jgi:hypothetical protein
VWVATILYAPLKGKGLAMYEQDKKKNDPAVAETVDTYPTPPAEVTVEKETEAAPPPPPSIEVTEVTWLGLGGGGG